MKDAKLYWEQRFTGKSLMVLSIQRNDERSML